VGLGRIHSTEESGQSLHQDVTFRKGNAIISLTTTRMWVRLRKRPRKDGEKIFSRKGVVTTSATPTGKGGRNYYRQSRSCHQGYMQKETKYIK